jgi:hypothetical protein
MVTAPGTVLWTLLTDADQALPLIHRAAEEAGFRTTSRETAEVHIDVPRSLRRRRRPSQLNGSVTSAGRRTEIVWTSKDGESELYEHLLGIEEHLPADIMYYHGLTDAAARAGLSFGEKKAIRDIVCLLDRDEVVRAVGKGHLGDEPGFVVLTGVRLVFVPECAAASEPIMDAPHASIGAVSLGKRISGETLRIALDGGVMEISRLGHGEGHGIATSFRETLKERARVPSIARRDGCLPGQAPN